MVTDYVPFGEINPEQASEWLKSQRAQHVVEACRNDRDFEVVEFRHITESGEWTKDVIVVDVQNDQIPSRNPHNLLVRERLALVFSLDTENAPEVRALRSDFPIVPHLNHVPIGEPASLCMYFEPWSATARTWTSQKHLRRILWWLAETAKGTLHRSDQPLEQLYFESPYELVLPPQFAESALDPNLTLVLKLVQASGDNPRKTLRAFFVSKQAQQTSNTSGLIPIAVTLPQPVTHSGIERYPATLGELADQLQRRGSMLLDVLRANVQDLSRRGVRPRETEQCVLLISVPMARCATAVPESQRVFGFITSVCLADLGRCLGVLASGGTGPYYPASILGDSSLSDEVAWRDIHVFPVSIGAIVTQGIARHASGVLADTATFNGVLAGVGALGATLIETWAKGSWGSWTIVDPDVMQAHNIIRHAGKSHFIGCSKVDAMKCLVEANYHPGYYNVHAIPRNVTTEKNADLMSAIQQAAFLVDATTTHEVPRDLSRRNMVPRSASVFLTPSGRDSVLLLEDSGRSTRLDSLEAQYYRAILNSTWGIEHLKGHKGDLWIGAGCRDASVIISYGAVQLHGAILAEQLRFMRDLMEARIRIWSVGESCSVSLHDIAVEESLESDCSHWRVLWDAGLRKRLRQLRNCHLPHETGGIVLGYIDHKTSTIAVVDVRPAPSDSLGDVTGFTRGKEGLQADVQRTMALTANVVGYIGEWHSHPPFMKPDPSQEDVELLTALKVELERDGEPALMLIVGMDGEVTVHVNGLAMA